MKKLKTLFKKDPSDLGRVINEIDPDCAWVFDSGIPYMKRDGTSCMIKDGVLYKRFDLKKGRTLPPNSIPCQKADKITGHHPHWTRCERSDNSNKYHFEAFDKRNDWVNGTYELCGEKVQGNPEKLTGHILLKHDSEPMIIIDKIYHGKLFEYLKNLLEFIDIEGIVFHHKEDDRMCKIRKRDFGIKR